MAKLIKNVRLVEDDWQVVTDDQPLPTGKVILSARRLPSEADRLPLGSRELGVHLAPGEEVESIADLLAKVSLVTLEFGAFTDGRHYTTARLLRERYRFGGEVRAVGEVLRDQLLFMQRCGIDAFRLPADGDPADALRAFGEFSATYQPPLVFDGMPAVPQPVQAAAQ